MIHKKTSRNVKEILNSDHESEEYLFAGNTSPSHVKQYMRNVKYGNRLFRAIREMHRAGYNLRPALDIPGGADKV